MTKVSIKNENFFNYGRFYLVADKFDQTISRTIFVKK